MFGLFKKKPQYFAGTGRYDFEVVGAASYQRHLSRICGGKTKDGHELFCRATLTPEPSNPHDKNAVQVSVNGGVVGYLPRKSTDQFHCSFGTTVAVDAVIVGGWDKGDGDSGHFGVRLDMP